ncbi:MAG: sugar phosphate isomerase/epimerase [Phycisphaerae bacterium]|nr:sugar phosphate isomerase/epimerase [Phycisphaerae bacterium]
MQTRTGSFPIGFRRGGSPWQKDLDALIAWAADAGFEAIDVGRDGDTTAPPVTAAGLRVGSVDLAEWKGMISPDKARRDDAVAQNAAYVEACAAVGVKNFFCVMLPEDPSRERRENFAWMVESFGQLAATLAQARARVVIEGYPGPGALCCTPADCRALFEALPTAAMGLNYDPSHLVRLGIDPLRFVREFADRVGHVHAKDTERLDERRYDLGTGQPPTFADTLPYGGNHWRYCIPGHGCIRWTAALEVLVDAGYDGCVCVELEDLHFNGSEPGEKQGLTLGGRYLAGC